MTKPRNFRFVAALAIGAILAAGPALASSISGTVTFQGDVFSASPIPGIAYSDLVVSSGPGIASSGGGEHCTIDTNGSAPVDALGAYPASGTLAVGLTIDVDKLRDIRLRRAEEDRNPGQAYTSGSVIKEEIEWAYGLFMEIGCPIVDVTNHAVEETAALVLKALNLR